MRRGIKPPFNIADAEWKIRELSSKLTKNPGDNNCRLELAETLEKLARFSEQIHDYLNAWRYYQGAAQALKSGDDKSLKKRADDDAQKAEFCHKLRIDYLSGMKLEGLVYVSFNWKKYKTLDPGKAMEYIRVVGLPMRKSWSAAKREHHFRLPEAPEPSLVVMFKIERDGTIKDIKLTKSSGRPAIDEMALQAVKAAGKAPPLLPEMGAETQFQAQFVK